MRERRRENGDERGVTVAAIKLGAYKIEMTANQATIKTIDDYIAGFPPEVREILARIRQIIRQAVPGAQEAIKYDMPTFMLHGNLVHFAAYKKHIALYPAPKRIADDNLHKELSIYQAAKSTLRFPLNKPIPYDLIRQVVRLLAEERMAKAGVR